MPRYLVHYRHDVPVPGQRAPDIGEFPQMTERHGHATLHVEFAIEYDSDIRHVEAQIDSALTQSGWVTQNVQILGWQLLLGAERSQAR